MNCIPLPDELIRKVYEYIVPIADYLKFAKLYTEQKKEEKEAYNGRNQLLVQLEDLNHNSTVESLSSRLNDKIGYYNFVIEYGLAMNRRLYQMQQFMNDNPLFKKYAKGRVLEGMASSRWDQENRISKIEKNIAKQRAKMHNHMEGNTFKHIMLYNDLVYILSAKGGCLETIIQHCRMNNISVITGPYAYLQRKAAGWSNEEEYRNYLVRKLMAL